MRSPRLSTHKAPCRLPPCSPQLYRVPPCLQFAINYDVRLQIFLKKNQHRPYTAKSWSIVAPRVRHHLGRERPFESMTEKSLNASCGHLHLEKIRNELVISSNVTISFKNELS